VRSRDLIKRVRAGDREALALFVQRHESEIRARFRQHFELGAARLFDSSDFFATVLRRSDALAAEQRADADLEHALRRIMTQAIEEYARFQAEDEAVRRASSRMDAREAPSTTPGDEDQSWLGALDETDRHIVRLRAGGLPHKTIADLLGMSAAAVRMRWHRTTVALRTSAWAERA
jgi:DNA-binding NarL/FixJ family response regulator